MPTDKVDDFITTQISEQQIAGLSLAIIQDDKIIKERGYGFSDKNGKIPITLPTLFQAGSVSKSLAAFGALRLVDEGELSLDADVNTHLRTWKVPENEFTKDSKVTLRGILSHCAGLTVHGFPGYAVASPLPTLLEVLEGIKPANTPSIRVDTIPGSQSRYSGGGYMVMQQMIIDVTGKSFPEFMHDKILYPLGMVNSTYDQPLPSEMVGLTATGYDAGGKMILGQHHIYPEMAAAGLWTTAADLARFVIGVQKSFAGGLNPIISQSMTRLMLTNHRDNRGFGVIVEGSEKKLRFYHGGRNRGFDAFLLAYPNTGNGLVILINANDDSGIFKDIFKTIVREYQWP